MKKLVIVIAALLSVSTASAINADDNVIVGLKGQIINVPTTGLCVELNLQKALSNIVPVYIETGISVGGLWDINWETVDFDKFDIADNSSAFVRIPVCLNYKFFLDTVTIYPSCGVALSCHPRSLEVLVGHDYFGNLVYEKQTRVIPNMAFSIGLTAEINKRIVMGWTFDYSNAMFLNPSYCCFSLGCRF